MSVPDGLLVCINIFKFVIEFPPFNHTLNSLFQKLNISLSKISIEMKYKSVEQVAPGTMECQEARCVARIRLLRPTAEGARVRKQSSYQLHHETVELALAIVVDEA